MWSLFSMFSRPIQGGVDAHLLGNQISFFPKICLDFGISQ